MAVLKSLLAMKIMLAVVCALGVPSANAWPQDAGVGATGATPPTVPAQAAGLSADQTAYYADLTRQIFELNANYRLLNELVQEHQKRAADTPRDLAAKAQWEADVAQELRGKASSVLIQLNDATRQKHAIEGTHPGQGAALATSGTSGATNGLSADAIAYLARLEDRLERSRQALAAALELGKTYSSQLLTNKSNDDFARVTGLMQDNAATVNRLEKEHEDLELRKLEFRALRRP